MSIKFTKILILLVLIFSGSLFARCPQYLPENRDDYNEHLATAKSCSGVKSRKCNRFRTEILNWYLKRASKFYKCNDQSTGDMFISWGKNLCKKSALDSSERSACSVDFS